MSDRAIGTPLPARLLAPWIEDNVQFLANLGESSRRLDEQAPRWRETLLKAGVIKQAQHLTPSPLAAVDAADIAVPLGDQVSVLVQAVTVQDDGEIILGQPLRSTGLNGHEIRLCAAPMRVAAECRALAAATNPTIADTSYWSFLMEVNQAITRREKNSTNAALHEAVTELQEQHLFINMLRNQNIIPMSKLSESARLIEGVSDREAYGRILQPNEYRLPIKITDGTTGKFGIERRGFNDSEWKEIEAWHHNRLGVLFYKPHAWTRAYRIEGHLARLEDFDWLMPVLSSISQHTTTRTIVEPWPQFLADYAAKQLASVAKLYGGLNSYRLPLSVPLRTKQG